MSFDTLPGDKDNTTNNAINNAILAPFQSLFRIFAGNNPVVIHNNSNNWEDELTRRRLERVRIAESSDYKNLISLNSSFDEIHPTKKASTVSMHGIRPKSVADLLFHTSLHSLKHSTRSSSSQRLLKSRKELSWSDEFGNKLAEFCEESSSIHEPNTSTEPAKPALTRSRSMKVDDAKNTLVDQFTDHDDYNHPQHHRPNFDEQQHYHMKSSRTSDCTTSSSSSSSSSTTTTTYPAAAGLYGEDSPQWGWYTHHSTPPTPQYYYNAPSKEKKNKSTSSSSSSDRSRTDTENSESTTATTDINSRNNRPQPNPVFQILQNKYKHNPNTWNVPY